MTQPAPVVVIGIGNAMRHDDGVGPAAIEQLRSCQQRYVDYITLDGESTRLLDAWSNRDHAVVIDAVRSGTDAGQVHRLEVGRDELPEPATATSSHRGGLAEAVALGRALDRLPTNLVVFGVEAADLSPGEGLSPAVAEALPMLLEQIRTELPARLGVDVSGIVQGVGFRPFVRRLAADLDLHGWVRNEPGRVHIEVEGPISRLAQFEARLRPEAPPLASVEDVSSEPLTVEGDTGFCIVASLPTVSSSAPPHPTHVVPPDVATCDDCLAELFDPSDRRYRHPFITCTNCGPRFTIITGLPYDRPLTTMARFPMCTKCAREYRDESDRRFHAQPLACPDCGPTLTYTGDSVIDGNDAVIAAAQDDLREGRIVAVKGLGGYHLACDATNAAAVELLRLRKERPDKPFAVMVADLECARSIADVNPAEAAALLSPARPIVLLRHRSDSAVTGGVAPRSPLVGVMLPSTPLHHLLLRANSEAPPPAVLVMTSGNLAEEPICYDDADARARLSTLVDSFCSHDRPIRFPCDDSVVRVDDAGVLPIRRSRGFAPLPITLPIEVSPTLAVGGELKNTFCLATGRHAWLSQHLGDMDNLATLEAFQQTVADLSRFHGLSAVTVAADRHPGYRTRRWALRHAAGRDVFEVQHHHAHLAALMAEHGLDGTQPILGFVFDGTGYGNDGQSWGGELLLGDYRSCERLASLRPVPIPGGDAAVLNPYRMALAHLYAADLEWAPELAPVTACKKRELVLLKQQMQSGRGLPLTTSMGRLFDAVASLLGVRQSISYEAHAAIELEFLAADAATASPLAFSVVDNHFDPSQLLAEIVQQLRHGASPASLARGFHDAVAEVLVDLADQAQSLRAVRTVGLTGGVFQNALLTSQARILLERAGYSVLTHRSVPPNDGGLALGQAVIAGSAQPCA